MPGPARRFIRLLHRWLGDNQTEKEPLEVETESRRANEATEQVAVELELSDGYEFTVDLDVPGIAPVIMDEPPPLGEGRGPNAARMLAAAIGHCLSASALFCLRKSHVEVHSLRTSVEATLIRNERGRLRVGAVSVKLEPAVDPDDLGRIGRCLELFEDYCVVTQSVRDGIDVSVEVDARAA